MAAPILPLNSLFRGDHPESIGAFLFVIRAHIVNGNLIPIFNYSLFLYSTPPPFALPSIRCQPEQPCPEGQRPGDAAAGRRLPGGGCTGQRVEGRAGALDLQPRADGLPADISRDR